MSRSNRAFKKTLRKIVVARPTGRLRRTFNMLYASTKIQGGFTLDRVAHIVVPPDKRAALAMSDPEINQALETVSKLILAECPPFILDQSTGTHHIFVRERIDECCGTLVLRIKK